MFSLTPTAKPKVRIAKFGETQGIAGIEFERALEFNKRASPFTTAAVNSTPVRPTIGVTRLELDGPVEFSQRGIIITTTPVMKYTESQMRLWRFRSNRKCAFDVRLYLLQLCRSQAIDKIMPI